jgi:hypothetical protein
MKQPAPEIFVSKGVEPESIFPVCYYFVLVQLSVGLAVRILTVSNFIVLGAMGEGNNYQNE